MTPTVSPIARVISALQRIPGEAKLHEVCDFSGLPVEEVTLILDGLEAEGRVELALVGPRSQHSAALPLVQFRYRLVKS